MYICQGHLLIRSVYHVLFNSVHAYTALLVDIFEVSISDQTFYVRQGLFILKPVCSDV